MNIRVLVVVFAFLASGCPRHRIAGTDIADTEDTREILAVMEKYRSAVEGRDVERLMALVSPEFRDNSGTSTPEDDLNFRNLAEALRDRFSRIENVHLDLDVRNIEVVRDAAAAVYYYTLRWEMPGLAEQPQNSADLKRMEFKRTGGTWKIVSGI
jgi:hypothetical protein